MLLEASAPANCKEMNALRSCRMMLINYIFENNDIDVWQILMYDPEALSI